MLHVMHCIVFPTGSQKTVQDECTTRAYYESVPTKVTQAYVPTASRRRGIQDCPSVYIYIYTEIIMGHYGS